MNNIVITTAALLIPGIKTENSVYLNPDRENVILTNTSIFSTCGYVDINIIIIKKQSLKEGIQHVPKS